MLKSSIQFFVTDGHSSPGALGLVAKRLLGRDVFFSAHAQLLSLTPGKLSKNTRRRHDCCSECARHRHLKVLFRHLFKRNILRTGFCKCEELRLNTKSPVYAEAVTNLGPRFVAKYFRVAKTWVGIIAGYWGCPLALLYSSPKFRVTGLDIDA